MSSASSHYESHSVEVLAHRSRALGHPSHDSRSIIVPLSPKGATLDNFRAAEALAIMRSCFNVDSIVTDRRLVDVREHYYVSPEYKLHVPLSSQRPYDAFLSGFSLLIDALEARLRFPLYPVIKACLEGGVRDMNETWLDEAGLSLAPREMFNLRKMKSGGSADSGSAAPLTANASPTVEVAASMVEKHPDTDENTNLRKRSKMAASEQPACAIGSTTKAPAEKGKELAMKGKELTGKGKEPAEVEEVPKRGYTIRGGGGGG
ncbi:hypothetical protein B296_00055221, partial [Ensete ventricosum]